MCARTRSRNRIDVTFHFKDPFLKISQNSRESVILLNFEGILFFWLRDNFLKFVNIRIFDLKPTFC